MSINKFLLYAIGPVGNGILGVLLIPLLTWFYNAEDIGRLTILQIFCSFIVAFFSFGLDQAYVRYYYEEKNRFKLLKIVIIPGVFLFLISYFLFLIFDPYYLPLILFDLNIIYINFLLIAAGIFSLLIRFLSLIMRMQDKAFEFSLSQLLPKIILVLLILFSYLIFDNKNIIFLLSFYILSLFFSFILNLFSTRNDCIYALSEKFDFKKIKELFYFGVPLMFGSMFFWGLNSLDRIFIKKYLSSESLGIYAVALSIASGVSLFSTIFNTIWSPLVFKWRSQGSLELEKLEKVLDIFLMITYFIVILFIIFSWLINFILPLNYYLVQFLVLIGIIGPLLYTLSEISGIGIVLSKKTIFSMYASLISVLINIILCWLFVEIHGLKGVSIASVFSFYIFLVLRTEFSRKCWGGVSAKRLYIISFILLTISVLILLLELSITQRLYLGFFMFFIGLYIFRKTIKLGVSIIRDRGGI